jgi:hypothetical protein
MEKEEKGSSRQGSSSNYPGSGFKPDLRLNFSKLRKKPEVLDPRTVKLNQQNVSFNDDTNTFNTLEFESEFSKRSKRNSGKDSDHYVLSKVNPSKPSENENRMLHPVQSGSYLPKTVSLTSGFTSNVTPRCNARPVAFNKQSSKNTDFQFSNIHTSDLTESESRTLMLNSKRTKQMHT